MKDFVDDVHAIGLREKSRSYMQRAYTCDDQGDHDGFLIWSSLALELLGKSALAAINPILILDTKTANSALAAIGKKPSTMIRTIGAFDVYERISAISPSFTPDLRSFCQGVANQRNIELHSAGQPFSHPPEDVWNRAFWHSVESFLKVSQINIEDWLGGSIAERGKIDRRKVQEAEIHAAASKIEKHREEYAKRTKKQNQAADERLSGFSECDAEAKLREASGFSHDHVHNEQNCPICKFTGWTGATCIEDSVTGEGYDQHGQYYQDPLIHEKKQIIAQRSDLT